MWNRFRSRNVSSQPSSKSEVRSGHPQPGPSVPKRAEAPRQPGMAGMTFRYTTSSNGIGVLEVSMQTTVLILFCPHSSSRMPGSPTAEIIQMKLTPFRFAEEFEGGQSFQPPDSPVGAWMASSSLGTAAAAASERYRSGSCGRCG